MLIYSRKLIAGVIEQGDEEINILKVLDTAFRRIVSSLVLIESGHDKATSFIPAKAGIHPQESANVIPLKKGIHPQEIANRFPLPWE